MHIAVIPARGNSKRLPRKNVKQFHGKPLIAYSIETAQKSGLFSEIWVSSEDAEIGLIAAQYGAKAYLRRTGLSGDEVSSEAVVTDLLRTIKPPDVYFVCMIYPTAPLMRSGDLVRGLNELMAVPHAPYSYSAAMRPQRSDGLRWDAGQWYWGRRKAWLDGTPIEGSDCLKVVIPTERVCDINTEADFQKAEILYTHMVKAVA